MTIHRDNQARVLLLRHEAEQAGLSPDAFLGQVHAWLEAAEAASEQSPWGHAKTLGHAKILGSQKSRETLGSGVTRNTAVCDVRPDPLTSLDPLTCDPLTCVVCDVAPDPLTLTL